jgi:hypothetical protein
MKNFTIASKLTALPLFFVMPPPRLSVLIGLSVISKLSLKLWDYLQKVKAPTAAAPGGRI